MAGPTQARADDLRSTLLNADYFFSVTIGPLPEGADIDEYVATGLKWPTEPEAG